MENITTNTEVSGTGTAVPSSGSRKSIAKLDERDFADCVNAGYRYTLHADGHLSAEYISRWSGSYAGQRYVTDQGYVDLAKLAEGDPDADALALLTDAVREVAPHDSRDWRQTRRGYLVR
jgi:hypothetical protein